MAVTSGCVVARPARAPIGTDQVPFDRRAFRTTPAWSQPKQGRPRFIIKNIGVTTVRARRAARNPVRAEAALAVLETANHARRPSEALKAALAVGTSPRSLAA